MNPLGFSKKLQQVLNLSATIALQLFSCGGLELDEHQCKPFPCPVPPCLVIQLCVTIRDASQSDRMPKTDTITWSTGPPGPVPPCLGLRGRSQ
jgi:hypothetical protein